MGVIMNAEASGTTFDYIKLIVENVSLWPILGVAVVWWAMRHPDILQRVHEIVLPGGTRIVLKRLEEKVERQAEDIKILETELALERDNLQKLSESFEAGAPLLDLGSVREKIKSISGQIKNKSELKRYLTKDASPEEIYIAAVILRESRPIELLEPLLDCLDRLAGSETLAGIRLNTVWTLTSALHRILIASIRDKVGLPLTEAQLRRTQEVLNKLERNSRVQLDSPLNPEHGVRGPINNALKWVEKGLAGRA